tara:strand:- start:40 stop:4353 length:4314 start_codon:yes stop_codon:yes gene_type:complete
MGSTSKDDLAVTLNRQENDVSQAVINETERLKTGDDLFRDSSDISRIFDPTSRILKNEPADISAFAEASSTRSGAEDENSLAQFQESKVPITPIGEGVKYPKEFTQLQEEAVRANTRFSISNEPDAPTGVDAWRTYWSNAFETNPDDETLKAFAVNTISGAGEIVAGFSDLKDKAVTAIMTGEGGLDFAKEFAAGFAATPEILANLIVAADINPLPGFNSASPEGKARVLEAQRQVWSNPLLPVLAATGLMSAGKGTIKAPAAVQRLAKAAKRELSDFNAISKSALKIAKGEVNKTDYSLTVNRLAEAIKDPAVYESTLKIIEEGKPFTGGVKKGYSISQVNLALEEVGKFAGTYFETINSLQNPLVMKPMTGAQKAGLENSARQLRNSILKQSEIIGDNSTITQLHAGFGITKLEAKLALEYIKNVGRGYGEAVLPKNIAKKIAGFQRTPQHIDPNKKIPIGVKYTENLLKRTDNENKINAAMNKPAWRDKMGKLAKLTYDIGSEVNFALDKAYKKAGAEDGILLKQVRIEKNLLDGTSGKAAFKIDQINSTIYNNLNRNEQHALNSLINIRRERSLKKHHDTELIKLNNELKVETKKPKIKKINDEIERINNYKYSGDKEKGKLWSDGKIATESVRSSSPWVQEGAVGEWLNALDDKNMVSKLTNSADDYFNVYKSLVDNMEKSGLITPDEAIRYQARDYTPKQYLEFMQGQRSYDISGKKITVTDRGIKKLKGGDEGILYNNSQQLLYDTVNSVENKIANNNTNNLLANLLSKGEIEGIGYLLKNANTKTKPGYVRIEYFRDGVKKSLALDDTFASGWIKSDAKIPQGWITGAQWVLGGKFLKASATGYNPAFAFVNMPRDMAYVTLTQHGLYSNNLIKAYGQMAGDMARVSKDVWRGTGRKLDYIEEGGSMTSLTGMGRLGDPFKPSNTKFKRGVRFAEAMLGKIGEYSENVTRLAIRERGIKNGLSPKEATWTARSYLDFSKQGQMTRTVETFIPYSGATIQATRGLLKSMGKKDFYIKAGQLVALQYAFRKFVDVSKERKEVMGRISDDIKFKNFVMPLPFHVTDKNGRKRTPYLKFPKDGGQSFITGIYDFSHNILTKERTSDYNMEQIKRTMNSLQPYELSRMAPTINVIYSWGVNRKFPWSSKIYKGDDRVNIGSVMTNNDEDLFFKDVGNALNISPAKLQYTTDKYIASGNTYADISFGTYDYIREQMSEEELDEYNKNFEKYIDMPISDIPGLRKIPQRFLGFAEDTDIAFQEQRREVQSDRANIREANNNEVSSFLLNYRHISTKEGRDVAFADMEEWIEKVGENFGEDEQARVVARYKKHINSSDLDLTKGMIKLTQYDSPLDRAHAIAYEMIKFKEDEKRQTAILSELQKISPVVKGKHTGYFNEETMENYNMLMEKYNKNGILKNPIFVNKDTQKSINIKNK